MTPIHSQHDLVVKGDVHNAPQDTEWNLECLPEPFPNMFILVLYLHFLSKDNSFDEASTKVKYSLSDVSEAKSEKRLTHHSEGATTSLSWRLFFPQ